MKRTAVRSLTPALAVSVLILMAFLAPSRNVFPFHGLLAACPGYPYGSPPVAVVNVTPSNGPASGGTVVTITGCGFTGASSVKFGTVAATSFTVNSDNQITATSPAHSVGTVDVTVTVGGSTSPTSPADQFTFTSINCYFNWYDNASAGFMADNVHLLNTSSTNANMSVSMPGAPAINVALAAGQEKYVSFPSGSIGGPVLVTSDQTFLATERVQYYSSFNEVWCEKPSQADTTLYIPWYDTASAGMLADNIHVLNPGSTPVTVTISFDGKAPIVFSLSPGEEKYTSFGPGVIGGPVKITATGPVLAAQRIQFMQSFNEEIAQSPSTAQTTSYFNWFDNASAGMMNDKVHIVNPQATSTDVTMTLGTQTRTATIPGGGEVYLEFPLGTIGGPVKITATQGILASQRVQFYNSFNEVPHSYAAQANTSLHIMWFDKASAGFFQDNIHILNTSSSTATVVITVGSATTTLTVPAGAERYGTLPAGTIGGPVNISSDQAVLAAQRIQYYQSFNEVEAMS